MPPSKAAMYDIVNDEPTHTEIVETSSCTSEESPADTQPRSNFTDLEYDPNSFFSPPSLPDLPNCVLSPLENMARESTPHSNKRKW